MRLIALQSVWFKVDWQSDETVIDVLNREPQQAGWQHMEPGDRIYFAHAAKGDTPYEKMVAAYPQYFRLERHGS